MLDNEFLKEVNPAQEASYIVEDLIRSHRLIIIASIPGEGKSIFIQGMIYHVTYGAPFGRGKTAAGNVVLIDSENRRDILQKRIGNIKKGLENDGYRMQAKVDIEHYSGFKLDNESTWQPIIEVIKSVQPSLIVLDHLLCFHDKNENNANEMSKVGDALEKVMAISNSSIVVPHHFNKNEGSYMKRLRGSTAIYAKCDAAYEVRTLSKKDGKLEKIGIIPQPRKDITPSPFRMKIEEGTDWLKLVDDGIFQPVEDPRVDLVSHRIYHFFLEDMEKKTVYDVNNILAGDADIREVRACLHLLHDRGLLDADREGKGGKWYYWPPSTPQSCPWCGRSPMRAIIKIDKSHYHVE